MDSSLAPSSDWTQKAVDNILLNQSPQAVANFRKQPLANKISALENAVVKPRPNNTADMVAGLLKQLVRMGALRAEEIGPLFSDLLLRVHKYNSTNVQNNLSVLMDDIRGLQSEVIRNSNIPSLSNQVVLNSFFNAIPAVVPMGQHNYEAFKQCLRLMINEAPNVTVFKSGPETMLQVNIRGVNTVNLNSAFENLRPFWGIVLDSELIPGGITSKLSSNTRVLMLFVAPFTNENTFTPDTFISQLMRLYRETVASSLETPGETEREILATAREMGTEITDVSRTLGYLLKNREEAIESPRSLTPRQLGLLRYIQESLTDRIDRNGEDPVEALQNLTYSFSPSVYESNGPFIRRIIAYLEIALRSSPNYFREIYSNKYWLPPASFWTQNYGDFYNERQEEEERRVFQSPVFQASDLPLQEYAEDQASDYQWDDFNTALSPSLRPTTPGTNLSTATSATENVPYGSMSQTIARAIIPPAVGAIGHVAGESLYPSLAEYMGTAASVLASRFMSPGTSRRDKRLKKEIENRRRRQKEEARRKRMAINQTPLPSTVPSIYPPLPTRASSASSGSTVYGPLLGDRLSGYPLMRPEATPESAGEAFSYLRPSGVQK